MMSFSQLPAVKKTSFLVSISQTNVRPFLFRQGFSSNKLWVEDGPDFSGLLRLSELYSGLPLFGKNIHKYIHSAFLNLHGFIFGNPGFLVYLQTIYFCSTQQLPATFVYLTVLLLTKNCTLLQIARYNVGMKAKMGIVSVLIILVHFNSNKKSKHKFC